MDQQRKQEQKEIRQQKRKRGFLSVFFSRTGIVAGLMLLQFIILFVVSYFLESYLKHYVVVTFLLGLGMAIYLVNLNMNASVKLTWLIVILLLPVFGTLLYFFLRLEFGHRRVRRKIREIYEETAGFLEASPALTREVERTLPELHGIASYLKRAGVFPVYHCSDVKYYPSGEENFQAILAALEGAKRFIFLEYFIIEKGYMWGKVLNLLVQKAQAGVTVRLLYDGTCEFFTLPHNYPKQLRCLGIECKLFSPIYPFVSTQYNYRDHRKILVVDGEVAFTGGVNFADEYINRKERFGHWKDVGISVHGDAAQSFTLMFLQMWNIDEPQRNYQPWLALPQAKLPAAAGYVIPYGDCPLDEEKVGEMVYMDILGHAERYVHIMTPYLILDGEMETALTLAAKRGIEVQIILPHIPDKKYAFALAKTHYAKLLAAGVQIFEYTPGFVHAKVFVSDDKKGVIGSINLDYRSFYHHFECAAYLYDLPAIAEIERDFQTTLRQCRRVTPMDVRKEKLSVRVAGKLLKLIAPLM